ncbi:MAG: hypothetical protein JJ855_04330 [Rhodospirillales bacterium]|nr:hypothetical protein [Rhodospirillales bacterium]
MQNLIELAGDVKNLMDQLDNLGASQERLLALNSRATQIHKVREVIDEANTTRTILVKAGVDLQERPAASKKLIKKCEQVRESFAENWEKTLGEKTLVTNLIEPSRDHAAKNVTQKLNDDWRAFVDETAPQISGSWLNSLPDSGDIGRAKKDVTECLQEIKDLRSDLPQDETAIKRVRDLSKKARSIFDTLDGIPEAVRAFLRAASGHGAQLDDLTDEVREWLGEHEMLDRLCIRFG